MNHRKFKDILLSGIRTAIGTHRPQGDECRAADGTLCRLCLASTLEYSREIEGKNRALQEFWARAVPETPLAPLVPSPEGRWYRSVSKRKAFRKGRQIVLGLIDPDRDQDMGTVEVLQCSIEPAFHARLFRHISTWINKPVAGSLHETLQYVIIKGTSDEHIVILSVRARDAGTVKAGNTLSKSLTTLDAGVKGVFLYEDESAGRYYLGGKIPGGSGRLQRLFGSGVLAHRTAGKRFLYSPLGFTQVNPFMLEPLVETVERLLAIPPGGRLFDLYAGYGLFTLSLAGRARSAVGIEISPAALLSAAENLRHLHIRNVRFIRSNLTGQSLEPIVRTATPHDRVILDPPRGGTAEGVIEVLAGRGCGRVVHLFCNIDVLPDEVARWKRSGYRMEQAIPLDMFPGTATVEIAAAFVPEDDRRSATAPHLPHTGRGR